MFDPINFKTLKEVLLEGSIPEPNSGCLLWFKAMSGGRGMIRMGDHIEHVSRLAYELWVGIIPEEVIVYHKCENFACLEPTHLGIRTQRWNVLQHKNNNQGNVCVNGHSRTVYGYTNPRGFISCTLCRKHSAKRYRNKKKFNQLKELEGKNV